MKRLEEITKNNHFTNSDKINEFQNKVTKKEELIEQKNHKVKTKLLVIGRSIITKNLRKSWRK